MPENHGEFGQDEIGALSNLVKGRIIQSIELCYGMNDKIVFHFTSGSSLEVEYDYLYGWKVDDPI